jgi:hypothetical protein
LHGPQNIFDGDPSHAGVVHRTMSFQAGCALYIPANYSETGAERRCGCVIGRTKQRHDWPIKRSRYMHRAGIIRNEKINA